MTDDAGLVSHAIVDTTWMGALQGNREWFGEHPPTGNVLIAGTWGPTPTASEAVTLLGLGTTCHTPWRRIPPWYAVAPVRAKSTDTDTNTTYMGFLPSVVD